MSEIKLKPCPFCGGVNIGLGYNGSLKYWYCKDCGASTREVSGKLLSELWNYRYNDICIHSNMDFSSWNFSEKNKCPDCGKMVSLTEAAPF